MRAKQLTSRFVLVFLASALCADAFSAEHSRSKTEQELQVWLNELPKPWNETEETLGHSLAKFHQQFPNYHDRLRALAYWRIGTPYKIFNLGEEQAPDTDPIFRMDVSDCTSHILTTMSLAESESWQQARDTLIQIHYKPDVFGEKKADYTKRWHFTADRLLHHKMTPHVSDVYIDTSKLKRVSLSLNQKQDNSEFLDIAWTRLVNVDYIPSENVSSELLAKLPSLIGVAFVKESYFKMGLVMSHEGMLMDGKYLLHAGQSAGQTVVEDFMAYYFNEQEDRLQESKSDATVSQGAASQGAKFDGIMLYELKPYGHAN